MKTTIIAATTNGDQFTKEALEQLSDSAAGVPVTMNFDYRNPIGKVLSSKVTDAGLEITVDLIKEIPGFALCPGYRVPNYEAVSFGATTTPQDKTLPKFETMKTNEDEKTKEQEPVKCKEWYIVRHADRPYQVVSHCPNVAGQIRVIEPLSYDVIYKLFKETMRYTEQHSIDVARILKELGMIGQGEDKPKGEKLGGVYAKPIDRPGELVNPLKGLKVRRGIS